MPKIETFLNKNPDIFWYMKTEIIPMIPWFYPIQKSIAYIDLRQIMYNNEYEEILYELKNFLDYKMIDKIEIEADNFCCDEWFNEFNKFPIEKIVWNFMS